MSTTLVVQFIFGRYHATPWGTHVNEGQVELPPSPWRLLRSLYAVWRTRAPELAEPVVHGLLGRLAEPPTYFVPPHRLGHSRHYYPDNKTSTDRTLDAFAVLDRDAELGIRWPFDLSAEHEKAFDRLARSLPYLGRADSVCEARIDPLWTPTDRHDIRGPLDIGESPPSSLDPVRLLAPKLPLDVEALTLRPVDVRAGKLLFPDATRFVAYERPTPRPGRRPLRVRPRTSVNAVRFAVMGDVLPPIGETVHVTDRLRRAALAQLGKLRPVPAASVLAGKTADNQPRRDHRHAHFLALPDDRRRLAELIVWAPDALADDEFQALAEIRRLWGHDKAPGPGTLDVRMSAYGNTKEILGDLADAHREWTSLTPFVPPRNVKRDWTTFVDAEVRRELRFRNLDDTADVLVDDRSGWADFVRRRPQHGPPKKPSGPVMSRGSTITLRFGAPVSGPIALGHLSHFGLGLFKPVR